MPFSDLENFKMLAEKLNFTVAAKALFMSQPSLSKSIGRLEDRLGFSLFDRNTREVELTAAGRSFYKDTIELLDLYEQAVVRARTQSKRLDATVRVGGHFANPQIYSAHDMARSLLIAENAPFEVATDARHVGSIERKPGLDDPFDDALAGVDDVNLLYCNREVAGSGLVVSEPPVQRAVRGICAAGIRPGREGSGPPLRPLGPLYHPHHNLPHLRARRRGRPRTTWRGVSHAHPRGRLHGRPHAAPLRRRGNCAGTIYGKPCARNRRVGVRTARLRR